jgi:hypothetical protein
MRVVTVADWSAWIDEHDAHVKSHRAVLCERVVVQYC